MTYAMSDIHGEYEKYRAMLEKIHFSKADTLYVLGDVVDRGPQPVEVLRDMMARKNVYPILGNHDIIALDLLDALLVEITEENYETHLSAELLEEVMDWQLDGGDTTMKGFRALDAEARADLLDYMRDFALYEAVDVGERTFVLVHAGLQNFDEKRPLSSYRAEELVLGRQDLSRRLYADPAIYVVRGHTPTQLIHGEARIYRAANNICIDCGASHPQGRLACLCLDTMEEFYI